MTDLPQQTLLHALRLQRRADHPPMVRVLFDVAAQRHEGYDPVESPRFLSHAEKIPDTFALARAPLFTADNDRLIFIVLESRWSPLTTPHLPTRLDRRSVALGAAGSRRGKVTIYFVVFDVLAYGADDLRAVPYQRGRARLEQLFVAAAPPLQLAPSTTDRVAAMAWIPPEVSAVGIEGMVASSSTPRIARAVPAHG